MKEFWHDTITDKSFYTLQTLRKEYEFVLIGGWAVFLYTKALKSKDIDMIVSLETLGRLKTNFDVRKNERLKKYEINMDGFDVDIYVPFYSELGVPADFIFKDTLSIDGFTVPQKEILLILKIFVYGQRKGSLKGKKDLLDIIGLLYFNNIDFKKIETMTGDFRLEHLQKELNDLLNFTYEVEELGLNKKQFSDFKKKIFKQLK